MDTTGKIASKGQLTLPKAVREALGIEIGDEVIFRVEGERAILAKTPDFLHSRAVLLCPPRSATWRGMTYYVRHATLGRDSAGERIRRHEHSHPTSHGGSGGDGDSGDDLPSHRDRAVTH